MSQQEYRQVNIQIHNRHRFDRCHQTISDVVRVKYDYEDGVDKDDLAKTVSEFIQDRGLLDGDEIYISPAFKEQEKDNVHSD